MVPEEEKIMGGSRRKRNGYISLIKDRQHWDNGGREVTQSNTYEFVIAVNPYLMDPDRIIEKLKKSLEHAPGLINAPMYSFSHKQLGELYYDKGDHLEAIYHFSEAHGVGLRLLGLLENARNEVGVESSNSPEISFYSQYAKGADGMLQRLQELPSEWTLIQLTRAVGQQEYFSFRQANQSPKLKDFYLTRFPCGDELKKSGGPVCVRLSWPEDALFDLIQSFIEIKERLGQKKGSASQIRKLRNDVSVDLERQCKEIGALCFGEWSYLLLGKLVNKSLEDEIREAVDKRIGSAKVSSRQRYLCHLLGEGSCHLDNADIEVALYHIFDKNETLAVQLLECIVRIKETLECRLHVAVREPLLLILDDHLDNISWECIPLLKRHPVSRVFSLHIVHALFKAHKNHIRNGVREINESEICYYIVNPDGNLPSVEEHIPKFFRKRFPQWIGIIGKKPTEEELIKALTESNTYVYCGHGSGSQYIASERIQRLKVKPLQMLFGCSSVALKDLGGHTEMYGDVMEFALARSGCTLGMLWPVTCYDTDRITMVLANTSLPGTPVDIDSFEEVKGKVKKEPELLRALRTVRECVNQFSNGAALIARGIPIKLVPDNPLSSSDYSSISSES